MKSYRALIWILLSMALLLCACGHRDAVEPSVPVAPEVTDDAAEPFTAVLCSDGDVTLRFRRDDRDGWQWMDDVSFPLDGQYVEQLIDAARQLDALPPLTGAEAPEAYGLVDSKCCLTLRRGDESQVTYTFGNEADDGIYCASSADEGRICVAPRQIAALLGRSIYDMALLPELPALSADQLQEVTVTRGDSSDIFIIANKRWLQNARDVSSQEQIQALSAALSDLSLVRCVDYAPAPGAAAVCGLEPPAATLLVELADTSLAIALGNYEQTEGGYYVTVGDSSTIYLMDGPLPTLLASWTFGE